MVHAETRAPGVLMRGPAPGIRGLVELDAEPGRVAANAFADGGRVLADAAGEHDRVQTAQRGGQRSEFAADAVADEIDGQLRPRIVRREKRAHVAGKPGHAEQPRLVIEEYLDRARVHAALVHEVENHAGVE